MVKQQKKSKQPMKVRNIEDLGINTQTGDMLSRALKIYNSPATSYKLPFTLGKPQNNPTVMAMDACINHIIDMCAPEWQALAVPRFLGYPMLSNIAQDPLIRSGIEVIVDDMTRKFIDLTSKGENDLSTSIAELESDLQSFRIKSIFNRALATTGYQGGCLVYIDVGELDDEEKKTPLYLDAATFKKGSFRGLRIIEPINLYPGRYDTLDPTSEDYFNPETWFVLGKEYHRSRFLYFAQNEVPLILKPLYNFFGISLAQQVLEYVQNFTENRRSAQRLLNKFSLTIWRTDMSQFLSGGDCNSLTQRVKYFNAQRSNDGTVLLDKETEEMEQINTPLSGVTDIVSMSLDLAPVILGISKDKYFGDLPKGLNASSEGTNRIYYDKIQSLNEKICYDNVEKVLKILQLNRYGEIDDNISFQFAPLWEMDERERAEINKVKADTVAVYLDRGALSAEEVRGALADNPDSGFSNIDVDDVPETESFADVDLDDRDEAGSVYDEALALDGRFITIKPNGEEHKGQPLYLEDGQSPAEAMRKKFGDKFKEKSQTIDIEKLRNELANTPMNYTSKRSIVSAFGNNKKSMELLDVSKELTDLSASFMKNQDVEIAEKTKAAFEKYKNMVADLEKAKQDKNQKIKDSVKKADFEIEEERSKALKIKKDGKTFWIQKRWIKDDGTLSKSAQEAFENAPTDKQREKNKQEYIEQRKRGVPIPHPSWESDKAYGFDLDLSFSDLEKDRRHRIFIPKSVIQENGNIPTWILEKKVEELEEAYPFSRYGGFFIVKSPFSVNLGFKDISGLNEDANIASNKDCEMAQDETQEVYCYTPKLGLRLFCDTCDDL